MLTVETLSIYDTCPACEEIFERAWAGYQLHGRYRWDLITESNHDRRVCAQRKVYAMTAEPGSIKDFLHWLTAKKPGVLPSFTLPSGKKVFGNAMRTADDLIAEYQEALKHNDWP